jgi:hypothetical protein
MSEALSPEQALAMIATGATTKVQRPNLLPRYNVGDRVVALNLNPATHTRLPRYMRGKKGTIARVHGMFALPDSRAIGSGNNEQYCYSVRFEASEAWGPQGRTGDCIYIDLWDSYLEPL